MFQTNIVDKIKKHAALNNFFFQKLCCLWYDMEYGTAREVTDDTIMRRMPFACFISTATSTLSIRNDCCFSTATTAMQTRLKIYIILYLYYIYLRYRYTACLIIHCWGFQFPQYPLSAMKLYRLKSSTEYVTPPAGFIYNFVGACRWKGLTYLLFSTNGRWILSEQTCVYRHSILPYLKINIPTDNFAILWNTHEIIGIAYVEMNLASEPSFTGHTT
jgi:hypothetical protein